MSRLDQRRAPTRFSRRSTRRQDAWKARPNPVARGTSPERRNGMLSNACSLPRVQAPSPSRHISETVQAVHSPTPFPVLGARPLSLPERGVCLARGNTCRAVCAAKSRPACAACRWGFGVCLAGSRCSSVWDNWGDWPFLPGTSKAAHTTTSPPGGMWPLVS